MSRDVTPLVLVQEVLKYGQHVTHTNPIVFEDNPLSSWKAHGGYLCEGLPSVRKIRVDRIVDTLRNFNSGFN